MKKSLFLVIALLILLLTACGGPKKSNNPCSLCNSEPAYVYTDEYADGSYCKDCYQTIKDVKQGLEGAAKKIEQGIENLFQ